MARPTSALSAQQRPRVLWLLGVAWVACVAAYFIFPTPHVADLDTFGTTITATTNQVNQATSLPRASYAEWVHGHWVSAMASDAVETLRQYESHGLPVDAIVLRDDFLFGRTDGAGELSRVIRQLRERKNQIRVLIALDGLVPSSSQASFSLALQKGYLLFNGEQLDMVEGGMIIAAEGRRRGALLDFSNPQATQWFESQLYPLLKAGLDGIFNDPADGLYRSTAIARRGATSLNLDGEVFSGKYYYDTFDLGRKVCGFDFVTSFRPVDSYGESHFQALGPQDISLATIVSGNSKANSFIGLQDSALHLLHSADRGYTNIGMSIGGNYDHPQSQSMSPAATQELWLRWAAVGAMTPMMIKTDVGLVRPPWERCGGAESAQLVVSAETCMHSYRTLVSMHRQLRQYFMSLGTQTFLHKISEEGRKSASEGIRTMSHKTPFVMRTLHSQQFLFHDPDSWDYLLGTDIFVAPVLNSSLQAATLSKQCTRRITFPAFGQWIPITQVLHLGGQQAYAETSSANSQAMDVFPARTTTELEVTLGEPAAFVRRGCVLPIEHPVLTGGVVFVIPNPHPIRASSVAFKYIPQPLRGASFVPTNEDGSSDQTEFVVVYGEHDHGMVLSYRTRRDATRPKEWFHIELKATPYHKPLLIHFKRARCVAVEQCLASSKDLGYHAFDSFPQFMERGVNPGGARAMFVGVNDIMLFDPFATIGTVMSFGPLKEET